MLHHPFPHALPHSCDHVTHLRPQFNNITGGGNQQPQSYIVSNADDLLGLFDADFGVLVIGEGAKILGPNEHGQEVLVIAEYLRLKHFGTIQVSQAATKDFPDLQLARGLEIIAGLLYVPLSQGGTDFIALLRKGQPRLVRWAGKPHKDEAGGLRASLEPRASFKVWSETVAGRCRVWTGEQLETAGVLALVYGKVRRAVEPFCLRTVLKACIVVHRGLARARAREGESPTDKQDDEYPPFERRTRRCVAHVTS